MARKNTTKPLDLTFSGRTAEEGRTYKVINYNMLAESIQGYFILLENAPNKKLYTRRDMSPESLIDVSENRTAKIMLSDVAGSVREKPENIEAGGCVEFSLFVDREDETIKDAIGEVNIILRKDGEEVSRATLP